MPYQYKRLLDGETRLLRLHRRQLSKRPRIDIIHVKLDECPVYEALSYRWDGQSPKETILADGQMFEVMRPVYEFLNHRQSRWKTHVLWIDSVCIDQANIGEKQSQIPLMRRIFATAECVAVWLGNFDGAKGARRLMNLEGSRKAFARMKKVVMSGDAQFAATNRSWYGIAQLFAHPWFRRVWVMQEVCVARKLQVYFGGRRTSWHAFEHILTYLGDHDASKVMLFYASDQFDNMNMGLECASMMRRFGKAVDLDANVVLRAAAFMEATLDHDKVYALLGLMNSTASIASISPRYDLSSRDVYRRAMIYALRGTQSLGLLHLAGVGTERSFDSLSWVPDLSRVKHSGAYVIFGGDDFDSATKIASEIEIPNMETSYIRLAGNLIDSVVRTVGRTAPEMSKVLASVARDDMAVESHFRPWLREVKRLLTEPTSMDVLKSSPDILWRALITYHETQGSVADLRDFFLHFEWWLGVNLPDHESPPFAIYGPLIGDVAAGRNATKLQREAADKFPAAEKFFGHMHRGVCSRRLAVTENGHLAVVPPGTAAGDVLCVIYGAHAPYVLRPSYKDMGYGSQSYELVGMAYVYEYMDGSAVDEDRKEMFTLV